MSGNISERNVFIGLFDILGFRELVRNEELGKVAETYLMAKSGFENNIGSINRLHEHSKKYDRVEYRVFSDTFLIYTSGINENCFLSMLAACDFLFIAAVKHSLPIRGTITSGPLIVSGGVEIGKPIVDAYESEQKQEWIGCWISDDCASIIDMDQYLENKSIVKYEIPLKDGEIRTCFAFNWVKSVTWKIMFENRKSEFTLDQVRETIGFIRGTPLNWPVRRKIENTANFVDFVLNSEFVEEYKSGKV